VLNGLIVDEWWIGKDLEGITHDFIELPSNYLPGRRKESHKDSSGIVAGVQSEIWIGHSQMQG
jgi:hypothetical protein